MAVEDTFTGAQTALTFYHAYLGAVGEEIGLERALALHGQVDEAMGAEQGKMIREQSGIEEFDAQTAGQMLSGAIRQRFGIVSQAAEESPERFVLNVGRCPVYEAALAAGMDAEAVEASCRLGAVGFMDAMAKALNPELSYRLQQFRSSPEGHCVEEVVLG